MDAKRSIISIMLILFLLITAGCGAVPAGKEPAQKMEKRLTISTSFYPMYIMTMNIVKDVPGVELVNIAPPQTGCLHDYQLTTNDLKTLEQTQILVVNGAGMENYLEKIIEQLPELKIVEATGGMKLMAEHAGQEHEHEYEPGHEHAVNAHVWVSISGAIQEVKNIRDQIARLDPDYAELYRKNGDAYIARLEELKGRMHQALDRIENKKIITFHEAFPYFAQEFGLEIAAVIQREPGAEPSAKEIADTVELIRRQEVKAIFAEPQYPPLAAEAIARETAAQVYYLDPAVTGDMDPDAYLKAMEANLKTLVEALKV